MATISLGPPIQKAAEKFKLDFNLIYAVIVVESNRNPFAWRAEPHYRYLWDVREHRPFRLLTQDEIRGDAAPADFPFLREVNSRNTEWWGQQASWGLMQVMGAVARELGFVYEFPALCNPENGIHYGCKHLANLRDRFLEKHGWNGVVGAYNAGAPRYSEEGLLENQQYVDKVANELNNQGTDLLEIA
jgi:hypothetical protein